MASNNQERCIYLIPPAVYNDRQKKRCIHLRFIESFSYLIIIIYNVGQEKHGYLHDFSIITGVTRKKYSLKVFVIY
jgi:hypothetical protein